MNEITPIPGISDMFAEVHFEQSATTGKISKAMAEAQKNIVMPKFNRTGQARAAKYAYADLGAVLQAAYATYAPQGIAVVTQMINRPDGSHLCRVSLRFEEEYFASTVHVPPVVSDQEFGARMTYRRRYNTSTICGLFAEEDTDEGAQDQASPRTSARTSGEARPEPRAQEPVKAPPPPETKKGTRRSLPPDEAEAMAHLAEDLLEGGKKPSDEQCRAMFQHYRSKIYSFDSVEKLDDWWGLHKGWADRLTKVNPTAGEHLIEQYKNARNELTEKVDA
jgi:hypothetical protein